MRLVASLCLGLVALLASSQSADAAFSFQLVPGAAGAVPGGSSVAINVVAFDNDLTGGFGFSAFPVTNLTFTTGGTGAANFTFNVPNITFATATATGSVIGTVTANALSSAVGGTTGTLQLSITTGVPALGTASPSGTFLTNVLTITAVPEPSSLALVGLASVGALIRRRRK